MKSLESPIIVCFYQTQELSLHAASDSSVQTNELFSICVNEEYFKNKLLPFPTLFFVFVVAIILPVHTTELFINM
jgi:hypothetical protein